MDKPEEPIIDFPIDRINRFLKNHIFEVSLHYGDVAGRLKLPIKVKLMGMKNLISVGDWVPYITYEFHVVPGDKVQNFMSSIYFGNPEVKTVPAEIRLQSVDLELRSNLTELLNNFLHYWGINHKTTCERGFTHVPYNIDVEGLR